MKIKRITFVIACCCASLLLPAQIQTVQYWFDGNFSERVTQPVTSGATLQLSEINAANLPEGLHRLHIRAKDNLRWSVAHSRLFYKMANHSGNTLTSYEYWIDSGFAGRRQENLSGNVATISELNFNTLSEGLHVLHFRALNNLGNYTATHSRLFYKTANHSGNTLTSYEYWIDSDFAGRRQENLSGNVATISELNFNTLSEGLHVLHFRALNNLGNYTATHSRLFYKNPAPEGENKIASYCYWFDDEFDTRQTVTLETPVSVYELTHNFDIPGDWRDGETHAFHIRFRDFSEQWSAAVTDSVQVRTFTGLNLLSESGLQIYPNPVKDLLNINFPNSENLESLKDVQILDIAGRVVETLHARSLQNGSATINVSHLPKGVYLVKAGNQAAKFIKR